MQTVWTCWLSRWLPIGNAIPWYPYPALFWRCHHSAYVCCSSIQFCNVFVRTQAKFLYYFLCPLKIYFARDIRIAKTIQEYKAANFKAVILQLICCSRTCLFSPDEGSHYVFATWNNSCECLASKGVSLQNVHQLLFKMPVWGTFYCCYINSQILLLDCLYLTKKVLFDQLLIYLWKCRWKSSNSFTVVMLYNFCMF